MFWPWHPKPDSTIARLTFSTRVVRLLQPLITPAKTFWEMFAQVSKPLLFMQRTGRARIQLADLAPHCLPIRYYPENITMDILSTSWGYLCLYVCAENISTTLTIVEAFVQANSLLIVYVRSSQRHSNCFCLCETGIIKLSEHLIWSLDRG